MKEVGLSILAMLGVGSLVAAVNLLGEQGTQLPIGSPEGKLPRQPAQVSPQIEQDLPIKIETRLDWQPQPPEAVEPGLLRLPWVEEATPTPALEVPIFLIREVKEGTHIQPAGSAQVPEGGLSFQHFWEKDGFCYGMIEQGPSAGAWVYLGVAPPCPPPMPVIP